MVIRLFLEKVQLSTKRNTQKLFANTEFIAISDTIEVILFCFVKLKKCTKIKLASGGVYGDIDEGVDTWDGFEFLKFGIFYRRQSPYSLRTENKSCLRLM